MKFSKINLIYYSPTGTGKKTLEAVAKGIGIMEARRINLTKPFIGSFKVSAHELAVFTVPVYGGRIPPVAADRLRRVSGKGTPAVLIVIYGNRAYDDTLIELKDITTEQGFKSVAGAAFIGEHSFSTELTPIALGRPDKEDLAKAERFGAEVEAKLEALTYPVEIAVPGNKPYKARGPSTSRSPETIVESCTLCGTCAEACPTGSITVSDKVETVVETCTGCSACVKVCPTSARVWTNEGIKNAAVWLNKNCSAHREPEFFL